MTTRLVAGPPGAGKNTYVEQNMKPADTVIDLDALVKLSAGDLDHGKKLRDQLVEFHTSDEGIAARGEGDLWVIRCGATALDRDTWRQKVKADEVVVLETPADVAKERIAQRARPGDDDRILSAVDDWWATYGVVQSDLIVRPDKGHEDDASDRRKQMADQVGDKGFPSDTPVNEMDDKQQAAYWKFHSRRHENSMKDLRESAGVENVDELKDFVKKNKKPAPVQETEEDKANKPNPLLPRLVKAEFKAALGSSVKDEDLDALLEDYDLSKFIKDNDVDVDRVKAKAALIAPASNKRRLPGTDHQGQQSGGGESGLEAGRRLAQSKTQK